MTLYRKVKCPECCCCNSTGYLFKPVDETEDYFRGREDGLMMKEMECQERVEKSYNKGFKDGEMEKTLRLD